MNENFIRFEADVQRQHARYSLPLRCIVDGRDMEVLDWSVAGVGVATGNWHMREGAVRDIQLVFPFDGYAFGIDLRAEVRYSDPTKARTGLEYVQVSPEQRRLLRYVLDAHLTGEVVSPSEIGDLNRRAVEAKARKEVTTGARRFDLGATIGRLARLTIVLAIVFGLIAFLAMSIFQRIAVFPAQSAFVSADLVQVRADSDGIVTNLVTGQVTIGTPIVTVLPPSGRSSTIMAPCDCLVEDVTAALDEQVTRGTRILSLRRPETRNFVVAMVNQSDLLAFYKGVEADVELADGRRISGASIMAPPSVDPNSDQTAVPVRIDLGAAADEVAVGEPASVRFYRTKPLEVLGLQGAVDWITTVIASLDRMIGAAQPADATRAANG